MFIEQAAVDINSHGDLVVLIHQPYHPRGIRNLRRFRWRLIGSISWEELEKRRADKLMEGGDRDESTASKIRRKARAMPSPS